MLQGVLQALRPLAQALRRAEPEVILDLGSLTALTMPTLSGCLLGFPAVYLIDSHECGQGAACILSLEGQMLHQLTSPCKVIRLSEPAAALAAIYSFRRCPVTNYICSSLHEAHPTNRGPEAVGRK